MKKLAAALAVLFVLSACAPQRSALCFDKVLRDGTVIRVCR